jgi:hypothetical protein
LIVLKRGLRYFHKYLLKQILLFGGLSIITFLFVIWLGSSSDFVDYLKKILKTPSENFFAFRDFTLNLFFRVTPFLVPIVITTSSIMINRYTGAYFDLVFKDKHLQWLFRVYIFYFIFHIWVITFTPIYSWDDVNDYIDQYVGIFITDGLIAFIVLMYTIYVCLNVFLYSKPQKLNATFLTEIGQTVKELNNKLIDKLANESESKILKNQIVQLIGRLTNLTVIGIKAKDYETIKSTISNIGKKVWITMIIQNLSIKTEDEEKLKQDIKKKIRQDFFYVSPDDEKKIERLTEKRIDEIIKDSSQALREMEEQVGQLYKDIYETAFSSKEFFACDEVIKHLTEITLENEGISVNKVFNIYLKLFNISLSYSYDGYTLEYCKRITVCIETIFNRRVKLNKGSQITMGPRNYRIYFQLIKECINFNHPEIMKMVLDKLKEHYDPNAPRRVNFYTLDNLENACIYTLYKKRMTCFGELIRFIVTKSFNLNEMNNLYSSIVDNDEEIEVERMSEVFDQLEEIFKDLDHDSSSFDMMDVFEFDFDITYLKLKFYLIFYSYYKLQCRISPERISAHYHNIVLHERARRKIPYYLIITVLLDLETHKTNWDRLFVSQSQYYFTITSCDLIDCKNADTLLEELEIFVNSELVKDVYEKLKDDEDNNMQKSS